MSFIHEIRAHRMRFIKTLALYASFIANGLILGVMGPTMMDLQVLTGTGIDKVSYSLTSRAGGFALGSFLTGIFYYKVNVQLATSISLAGTALLVASIPFYQNIYFLIAAFFVIGIMTGFIDSCVNVFLIHVWGKENPPFMQALHFCFGIGALLAPLIASPFLLDGSGDEVEGGRISLSHASLTSLESAFGSTVFDSSNMNLTDIENENTTLAFSVQEVTRGHRPEDVKLIYPYSVIAVFYLCVSALFLVLWRMSPQTPQHPSRDMVSLPPSKEPIHVEGGNEKAILSKEESERALKKYRILVIFLVTLFMHLYCGIENTFGSFISPFAVKCDLHLSQQTGALISSIFWVSFTFFRLTTVFYIDFVGAEKNIMANLALALVANVVMVPFGNKSEWALWTGSSLMGLGLSSIYASVLGFLEDYFQVTSQVAVAFIISACLGHLTVPAIISPFIESYPQIFIIMSATYSFGLVVLFATAVIICRYKLVKNT